jgi:stress response protein YsnF
MSSIREPSLLPMTHGAAVGPDNVPIAVVEERARIDKRALDGDRVRVTTHTDLVEEHVRESLLSDEVEIMRVAVNRLLEPDEAAPKIRTEDNVTIVPVFEEVIVAVKRLLLKEEIHILRDTTAEEVDVPVTLRKQRASVERTGPDGHSHAEPILSDDPKET